MNISLNNKIVVVTGGVRGVGRGIARVMAQAGAKVILLDRDEEMGKEAVSILTNEGLNVSFKYFDLLHRESYKTAIDEIISENGGIDVLVNNAGVGSESSFEETSYEELMNVFQINLFGAFELSKLVVTHMKETNREGSILFTSSTHQKVTMLRPVYSMSKAALSMLVKEMALELTPKYAIRVNGVAPGVVAILGEEDRSTEHVPIGYAAIPEDIGKAMVFLASDEATYITGHTLVVDGAFSLAHTHYWIKKEKI